MGKRQSGFRGYILEETIPHDSKMAGPTVVDPDDYDHDDDGDNTKVERYWEDKRTGFGTAYKYDPAKV